MTTLSLRQPISALPQRRRRLTLDFMGSLIFHLLLLASVIYLVPLPKASNAPPEPVVQIEMVPPAPAKPLELPPLATPDILKTPPHIAKPDVSANATTPSVSGEMQQAKQLFATDLLKKPINAKAVAALGTLEASERVEQLCDIEGMAQIAATDKRFAPDILVAYAMANTRVKGRMLLADGAAFRSRGRWYRFKFACEISGSPTKVVSFSFNIGAEIPKSQWADHYLTASDPEDDDDG